MLKLRFGFPCCFFFRMMVPLNLVHSDGFSTSASFFSVQHSKWMFCIGQFRFNFDGLGINDLGRNLEAFPKLGHMKDIMDGH
jgi:hypothetical protein